MSKPNLIICPGVHPPQLTSSFIQNCLQQDCLVLPTQQYLPYNAIAIEQWLKQYYPLPVAAPSLAFIAFSAGVVGGIIAAHIWQLQGGKIDKFIAFDGWGMPLIGNFPIYRVSHDRFTHWSSSLLGLGESGFYAEPAVEHLDLWRSPHTCWGWQTISFGLKTRCSLNNYLHDLLDS